jgi:hypothetical protein
MKNTYRRKACKYKIPLFTDLPPELEESCQIFPKLFEVCFAGISHQQHRHSEDNLLWLFSLYNEI